MNGQIQEIQKQGAVAVGMAAARGSRGDVSLRKFLLSLKKLDFLKFVLVYSRSTCDKF